MKKNPLRVDHSLRVWKALLDADEARERGETPASKEPPTCGTCGTRISPTNLLRTCIDCRKTGGAR